MRKIANLNELGFRYRIADKFYQIRIFYAYIGSSSLENARTDSLPDPN